MGQLSVSGSNARTIHLVSPDAWGVQTLFGRLSEVSSGPGTAALTLTLRLAVEAQRLGEPVAWITDRSSSFFPPDARATGVDLDALVCVFPPRSPRGDGVFPPRSRGNRFPRRSPQKDGGSLVLHAADLLVRSGGFGLVVLDLGGDDLRRNIDLPMAMQSRLAGLARRHQTAILCLTEKSRDERSLGSLVSLRVEAVRAEKVGDRFRYEVHILKDKHSGSGHSDGGWRPEDLVWEEACHAPDGLC